MPPDAQTLWAEKYAARFAAAKFAEDESRERAFVDDVFTVCGERLRGMTPRDLLHLQAIGSPVIYGHADVTAPVLLQFLWAVHTRNRGPFRLWHRARMIGRVMARRSADPLGDATIEIAAYLSDMFLDAPSGGGRKESRPLGACWLAPILVRLSSKVGPQDPLDGRPWADSPLPRVWQYLKAARASEDPKFKDYSPSDRVMSDWQAEVNRNAEQSTPSHGL